MELACRGTRWTGVCAAIVDDALDTDRPAAFERALYSIGWYVLGCPQLLGLAPLEVPSGQCSYSIREHGNKHEYWWTLRRAEWSPCRSALLPHAGAAGHTYKSALWASYGTVFRLDRRNYLDSAF